MFLNSWLCLSKEAIYAYKWSFKGKYIDSKDQISIKWNDSRIKFNWPVKKPILSSRDKVGKIKRYKIDISQYICIGGKSERNRYRLAVMN